MTIKSFLHSGDTLGEIITWGTRSDDGSAFKTTLTDIRAALKASGLPESLARELCHRNAFSRALHGLKDKGIVNKVSDVDDIIQFQLNEIVRNGLPGDEKLDLPFLAILALNKVTGIVTCSDQTTNGIKLRVLAEQLLNEAREARTAADVTRLIQRAVSSRTRGMKGVTRPVVDLIKVRQSGGMYFVFGDQLEYIDMLEFFCEKIGATFERYTAAADERTTRNIARDLQSHLEGLIGELNESMDKLDDPSEKIVERRVTRIADIRSLISLRRDFLASAADELETRLADADKILIEFNTRRGQEAFSDDDQPTPTPEPIVVEAAPPPEFSSALAADAALFADD